MRARGADGVMYAAFLLVGPVLVMALFRDRQIRYLVPMLPAAAVLTAAALREWCAADPRDALIRWIARLHWATVLALAIGFPLAASLVLEQGGGDGRSEKWLPLPLGVGAAAAGAALVVAGARLTRGGVPGAGLVPVTACVMLALQPLFIFGYRRSDDGRADMRTLADLIVSNYPSAHVFALNKFARPDMNIYLDRPVPRFDGAHDLTDPQPDILLVFDDEDPGQPALPGTTAEWTLVGTAARGHHRWLAYLHDDR
jgi:hypothetical protein